MKTNPGRFFEDYKLGEVIVHAVPRTLSGGERALYHALYPARHALYSSDEFARASGLHAAPLDDLIAFDNDDGCAGRLPELHRIIHCGINSRRIPFLSQRNHHSCTKDQRGNKQSNGFLKHRSCFTSRLTY